MSERPPFNKQESFSYLSYYQSALADVGDFQPQQIAEPSTSGSKPSTPKEPISRTSNDSSDSDYSSPETTDLPTSGDVRRRPSKSSRTSNDRRRLAIVETRIGQSSNGNARSSERSRSKQHMHKSHHKSNSSFSLVAPPDASPSTYQDLTPPSIDSTRHRDLSDRKHNRYATHHAGASDSEFRKEVARRNSQQVMSKITYSELPKSSTTAPVVTNVPVGILDRGSLSNTPAMSSASSSSSYSPAPSPPFSPKWQEGSTKIQPGFQSITGLPSASLNPSPSPSGVVNLYSSSPKYSVTPSHRISPSTSTVDVNTQLHSEKRLRRDLSSDTQSADDGDEGIVDLPSFPRTSHAREGAFPPSRIVTKVPSADADVTIAGLPSQAAGPHSSEVQVSGLPAAQEARYKPAATGFPSSRFSNSSSSFQQANSTDVSLDSPTSAASNLQPLKDGLTPSKDGLSLPLRRAGSWVSMSSNTQSESGQSAHHSVHSPSPLRRSTEIAPTISSPAMKSHPTKDYGSISLQPSSPSTGPYPAFSPLDVRKVLPSRVKIKSISPDAMFFSEILSYRSAHERALGYAKKINDLYMHDSGLGDWIQNVKAPGSVPHNKTAHQFIPQPRHTSRSSAMSEVSFPRRPDSSIATDLSRVPSPPENSQSLPSSLPYPTLAHHSTNGAARTPLSSTGMNRGLTPISPMTNKSMGFFASLGRRTSSRKAERATTLSTVSTGSNIGPSPLSSPATAPRVLTKPSPSNTPKTISKPMPALPSTAGVPGGPRAIPNKRTARSQTVIISSPFSSNASDAMSMRGESRSAVNRRPSMLVASHHSSSSSGGGGSTQAPEHMLQDPDFSRQVDKLADLLPHAERRVLAGYLYRSGQDIAAIGQYLEDEQKGRIKR